MRSKDMADPNFRRLYYVRYADDFVIGYVGTKAEARTIYNKTVKFLDDALMLKCNESKTSITHGTNKFKYLGTTIRWVAPVMSTEMTTATSTSTSSDGDKRRRMIPHNKPEMTAPVSDIITRMRDRGFCVARQSNPKLARATSVRALTQLELDEIVIRYNSIIRGILNYYSFVSYRSKL